MSKTETKPEPVLAEPGKPLTPERIATIREVSDARISPDGRLVAYVVREASKAGEHRDSAIWVVPFDEADGEARQFTSGLTSDLSPRWSPDPSRGSGQAPRLAFLSDRAERGKASVYVMPADGGEALRVFDQQGEVSGLSWSPDGLGLAVLFTDPETEEEKKRKEERDDARVWDHEQKYQRLWVIDPEEKKALAASPAARQVHSYAWAPDSERLAICTTPNARIDDIFGENEVAVVKRDGGDPTIIYRQQGTPQDLTWSADGEWLVYRSKADGAQVMHAEHVWRIPAGGGEPVCLTPGYGGTLEWLSPIDGGDALLACGLEGFDLVAYRLSLVGGDLMPLLTGQRGWSHYGASVSRDGRRIALARETATEPANVWVAETPNGELRRRTDLNPDLPAAALGETERVEWQSDPGVVVHGLLVKPHGYEPGRRYPLVVQVHGGPTWAWSDWLYVNWHHWAQMLAGRGYAVLMPNPRGSTGRGSEWSNAIVNDVGGGEYRDLLAGVDAMIERGLADPERLGIGGWSWGGYMTAWAVSQTTRFKAAIMGAGLPNMVADNGIGDIPSSNLSFFDATPYDDPEPYWQRSAIRYIRNVTTPTLILHGEDDARVNVAQGLEMYTALRTLGVETQFVTYPREEHGLRERKHQIDLMRRVIGWYDRYLKES